MTDAVYRTAVFPVPDERNRVRSTRPRRLPELVLGVLVSAGDVALAWAWLNGGMQSVQVLGIHAAVSCFCVGTACGVRRAITARDVYLIWTLLLLGPFSGMLILLQEVVRSAGGKRDRYVLHDTAELPPAAGRADTVYAAIRQDRRLRPLELPLASFADSFAEGDLTTQNAAIAVISRHYGPEMFPALKIALGSETAAVRVQAAAVFAKYRTVYGVRARELIAAGIAVADAEVAVAHAVACREVAAAGFLDRTRAETLGDIAAKLETYAVRTRRSSAHPGGIDGFIAEILTKPGKHNTGIGTALRLCRYVGGRAA